MSAFKFHADISAEDRVILLQSETYCMQLLTQAEAALVVGDAKKLHEVCKELAKHAFKLYMSTE